MKTQKLTKIIVLVLFVVFVVTCLYFFVYLNYLSEHKSKYSLVPGDIKNVSEIFNPKFIIGEGESEGDEQKTFYFDKANTFFDTSKSLSSNETRFIKKMGLSYAVSGSVSSIKENQITLKNPQGESYVESLNPEEIASSEVFLLLISPTNPTRTKVGISDIKVGDYIILEKTINLLNNSQMIDVSIELLRSSE